MTMNLHVRITTVAREAVPCEYCKKTINSGEYKRIMRNGPMVEDFCSLVCDMENWREYGWIYRENDAEACMLAESMK